MKRKPFTYSDRMCIENMLNEKRTIKEMEKDIKRGSSGIIKEINKNKVLAFPSSFNNTIFCAKWNTCTVKERECYISCKNVEFKICPKLSKSPHVCNGCTQKNGCRYVKAYYRARPAHDKYKLLLSESRNGLHYSKRKLDILNDILCPLIIHSKSIYHAVTTVNKKFKTKFKEGTIYKQIERGKLNIEKSDLPRTRTHAKPRQKDISYKRNIKNHTYEDRNKYKKHHPNACETQMDTVEGTKENNAPVLLTLEIVDINFIFMFKIGSQTINDVVSELNKFRNIIENEVFNKIMEILLTDNGKEFYDVDELQTVSSKINIFYCHPYSSYEKGSIENNHELIRRVIPKGVSLKPYTQNELNLLCSHINSLSRKSLNGDCPFDLIDKYISLEKINSMGLYKIDPMEINLIPELLGKKNIDNIKKYLDYGEIKKANIKFLNE